MLREYELGGLGGLRRQRVTGAAEGPENSGHLVYYTAGPKLDCR